jgi:hypothetical protein
MRLPLLPAIGALIIVGCALPLTVLAHHGFSGRYDRSAPVWLAGTVTAASFGLPHSVITLTPDTTLPPDVGEFADGLVTWTGADPVTVEFPPVARFFDIGDMIAVGDRIGLVALRNCDEPHQLRGQWVQPATGVPVVREGRMQEEVAGC